MSFVEKAFTPFAGAGAPIPAGTLIDFTLNFRTVAGGPVVHTVTGTVPANTPVAFIWPVAVYASLAEINIETTIATVPPVGFPVTLDIDFENRWTELPPA
jgi:hypothetical protein